MALLKDVTNESAKKIHNAGEFYPIHLDNSEYILSKEVLLQNVGEKTLKEGGWHYPDLHFLRFQGKRLELQSGYHKSSYKLSFIIEKDCLSVACSCRKEVEKLCLHAYKTLLNLMFYSSRTSYFQSYAPKGLVKTAFANKKYFDIKNTDNGLEIQAKKQMGFVHMLTTDSKMKINLQDVLSLPSKEMTIEKPRSEFSQCYMILVPTKQYILPFVLPFLGQYNKAHTHIKSFRNFLTGLEKENEHLHAPEQKVLNNLCLELYKEVEAAPKLFETDEDSWEQKPQSPSKILEYWLRIFPMLQGQHVYTYRFWHYKYLKRRPEKCYAGRITIGSGIPEIQFHLTEYGRYYQMRIEILIKGRPLNLFDPICSILIQHEGTIYLLRSFKDSGLVEWFYSIDNNLTIFKEQFKDFEKTYLRALKKNYPFHIKRLSRSKK